MSRRPPIEFVRSPEHHPILNQPVVLYREKGTMNPWTITATAEGVRFTESPTLIMNADLQNFAKALSDAFRDHIRLSNGESV